MLAANPAGDRALIDTEPLGSFGLGLKVLDQVLEDAHLAPSYGITHNLYHGNTCLQGYGSARNTQPMELKDRLKMARKRAKLTQAQLADAVGITQTSITDLERGKSQSSSYVAELARACGVDALWLATGLGEMTPEKLRTGFLVEDELENYMHGNVKGLIQSHKEERKYPLISFVVAGAWAESCDNFQPGDADEWLESDVNAGPHGYWLEVSGLSMVSQNAQASFPPKMRILVKPEGFDIVTGKFYVAKLMDTGETTFKQYVRDAGVEYLQPLNPSFKTIEITENVKIIGRVVDARMPKSIF